MNSDADRIFTTPELAAVIGKTVHKTISYINRGYIEPSIQDASGHGSKRLWSYQDVVRMCLIEYLEAMGLSVAKLREIGDGLTEERMAENRRLIIHGPHAEDIAAFVSHTIEGDPYVPHDIPAKEIRFDISPGKLVVSMYHMHKWAQDRIEDADRK